MPDGIRRDQFLQWVESLTDRQTPSWLGLPNNAEKVLLTTRGKSFWCAENNIGTTFAKYWLMLSVVEVLISHPRVKGKKSFIKRKFVNWDIFLSRLVLH